MNRQQIAAIYDSMPPEERDMSREQFIRETEAIVDPVICGEILAQMVHGKQQARQGRMQKAIIDSAITRGK